MTDNKRQARSNGRNGRNGGARERRTPTSRALAWWLGDPPRRGVSPPPRIAARRFYIVNTVIIAILLATATIGWAVWSRVKASHRWKAAIEQLKADVPAFSNYAIRPIRPPTTERASELVDEAGQSRGIVLFRADGSAYVTFIMPGLRYRPCSDARTQRLVAGKLPEDPRRLRMIKHALGAALLLWPELPAGSVSVDKIEAVSLTARNATARLGIVFEGRHLGAALEIDLFHRRLLALEVRRL